MKLKIILFAISFFSIVAECGEALAASYTVCASGCNYTTIQAAVNACTTGTANTITVQGVYTGNERVTIARSGAGVGSELHILAEGTQTMKGFYINGNYVIVEGFDITGHTVQYTGLIQVAKLVGNIIIRNNTMRDTTANVYGIYSYDGTYAIADYPHHITVTGNTIANTSFHMISLQCNDCVISNNTIGPSSSGFDAIRFFGRDSIISHNEFKHIIASGASHTDIFQTFGNNGTDCYNVVFEGNYVHCGGAICTGLQPCNISGDGRTDIRDITFRNNIFVGLEYSCAIGVPNVNWYNNVFVDSGRNTFGPIGYRYNWSGGTGTGELRNNVFIGNGSPDGDAETRGWWYVDTGATGGVTASNNYVSKTRVNGYEAKTGWNASNGNINGGNPLFVNDAGTSATDYHLQFGSPLKDAGTTIDSFSIDYAGTLRPQGLAWDIGAYEYVSGAPTVTPPAAPTGLTVQ